MRAAVALRFRADLRRRWRTWLLLAVVGAAVAGPTMAVAAGARRTQSAPDRFAVVQRAPDLLVPNYPDEGAAQLDPDDVASHDAVVASARFLLTYWQVRGDGVALILPRDDEFGRVLSVPRILDGRAVDPARVDEATASHDVAERFGLEVGDELIGFDEEDLSKAEEAGLSTRLTIVGIEARPLELGQAAPALLSLHGTPALYQAWHSADPGRLDGVAVTLRRGEGDAAAFKADLEAMDEPNTFVHTEARANLASELDQTARLLAEGIWLLAALLGVVGIVLVYAAHVRTASAEGDDERRLRALGWTRAATVAASATRTVVIGVSSAVLAIPIAVALSPIFPIGLAGVAEPDRGARVDGTVLAIGASITLALTVVAGSLAGLRVAVASSTNRARSAGPRVGRVPRWATLGARFALASGARGVARITSATVAALVVLTGLAGFIAGADHTLQTPRSYGWPWQLVAERYEEVDDESALSSPDSATGKAVIDALPGVVAAAMGDTFNEDSLTVNGHHTGGFMLDTVRGDPGQAMPPITAGRLPTDGGEIALGPKLMDRAGVDVGDQVMVADEGMDEQPLTVVGEVVVPASVAGAAGSGVLLPRAATFERFGTPAGDDEVRAVYLRLEPGARSDDVLDDLNRGLGGTGSDRLFTVPAAEPRDVAHLLRTSALLVLLAVLLAGLAATTLVLSLVASTFQRRRDIAVLQVLGISRRAARAVLVWQAVCLAGLGVVVALPAGVLAGRWTWWLYADRQGFVPEAATPWALLTIGAVALVGLAATATVLPARAITSAAPARMLTHE